MKQPYLEILVDNLVSWEAILSKEFLGKYKAKNAGNIGITKEVLLKIVVKCTAHVAWYRVRKGPSDDKYKVNLLLASTLLPSKSTNTAIC